MASRGRIWCYIINSMKKIITIIFLLLTCSLFFAFLQEQPVLAQEKDQRMEAVVSAILEERLVKAGNKNEWYQKLKLSVTKGYLLGKSIILETGTVTSSSVVYKVGDKVLVTASKKPDGSDFFYITDYIRRTPLYILFGVFIFFSAVIGRKRGVASLAG